MIGLMHGLLAGQAATAGDPSWANVSSLLHLDGANGATAISDEKGRAWTAVGNAQISTAQSKFGGSSLYLDGSGDYLSTPFTPDLQMGTGDFTIEGWVRLDAVGSFRELLSLGGSSATNSFVVRISNANQLQFVPVGTSGNVVHGTALVAGTWHHFAFVRAGGVVTGYLDGIKGSTAPFAGSHAPTGSAYLGGNTFVMKGFMDDIRITKGVARYVSSFTPPTAPYPGA